MARLLRLQPPLSGAFLLVSVFSNCGNLGLPLSLFAFGQEGLDLALVYTMISLLLVNSVGVYVASRGRSGTREALLSVVRAPVVWAALLAVLVNLSGLRCAGSRGESRRARGQRRCSGDAPDLGDPALPPISGG